MGKITPAVLVLPCLLISACPKPDAKQQNISPLNKTADTPLKTVVDFPVGVAVAVDDYLQNDSFQHFVNTNFDIVTPENAMKLRWLKHHDPDAEPDYSKADQFVGVVRKNGLQVHGHAWIWYKDSPMLLQGCTPVNDACACWKPQLEDYIMNIGGHYRDQLASIDVVNEAIQPPQSIQRSSPYQLRPKTQDKWRCEGDDYIFRAFLTTRATDPAALLYYNESQLSYKTKLQDDVYTLVKEIQSQAAIDGVGFQMHITIDKPSTENICSAFKRFSALNLKIRISEMDVQMNKREHNQSVLTQSMEEAQAKRYGEVIQTYFDCVPPNQRGGITFWRLSDKGFTFNYCAGKGDTKKCTKRPDWPRLFDANMQPKPAWRVVREVFVKNRGK